MQRQEILTVEDISRILNLSKNTIQRRSWQEKSKCPFKKIGRRLYVLASEFWKWFEGHSLQGEQKESLTNG